MLNGPSPQPQPPTGWVGLALSLIVFSKVLFILQTVFKEPALGFNYHFLRAFVWEFVYLGFDQIVSFLCSWGVRAWVWPALPHGAGGSLSAAQPLQACQARLLSCRVPEALALT